MSNIEIQTACFLQFMINEIWQEMDDCVSGRQSKDLIPLLHSFTMVTSTHVDRFIKKTHGLK